MTPDELLDADDHLAVCEACRLQLLAMEGGFDAVDAIQDRINEAPPVRTIPRRWAWAAGAAAAFAAAAALFFFVRVPQANAPPAPPPMATLRDGGGILSLSASGELAPPAPLPPEYHALLLDTLRSSKLPAASIPPELRPGPLTLLAERPAAASFRVFAPAGQVLLTQTPEFAWEPLPGAPAYTVSVFDEEFRKVAASGPVASTRWRPSAPLPRGAVYSWQVQAGFAVAPAPPDPEARFSIASQSVANRIEEARRRYPGHHLLLAALAAKEGLSGEAGAELRALSEANPGSPTIAALLASLRER